MTTDKIDNHYFQQLSALMDGDLPPDQARFLLRRMEHDAELTGCWERWQLCGDALRGQARAPAPAGFAERIATAIAADAMRPVAQSRSSRGNLGKWGGGALAASIAAVALFMVRQQVPEEKAVPAAPVVASQAPAARLPAGSPGPLLETAATVTAASVAVASVPRRQNTAQRRSATRNQQVARNAAASRALPDRSVASASAPLIPANGNVASNGIEHDPFANVEINGPASRPWPRAALPRYSGGGAFSAGYSSDRSGQTFYPFEPRLPITAAEPAPQD